MIFVSLSSKIFKFFITQRRDGWTAIQETASFLYVEFARTHTRTLANMPHMHA